MTATVFDVVDALVVATTFVPVVARRQWHLLPAPLGLTFYHIGGRIILTQAYDPALSLAIAQTCVAVGFLFSAVLTNYGRLVGSIFLAMSMSGALTYITDTTPPLAGGLGLNLWNFQSLALHIVAVLIITGALRHASILRRRGADRL